MAASQGVLELSGGNPVLGSDGVTTVVGVTTGAGTTTVVVVATGTTGVTIG